MSYTINHYNGTLQATVSDGTVDTSTSLTFIGKNYAGYGQAQNDNFLWLLENFCNTTQPSKPVAGQIWYDSGTKRLKFFDGSTFRTNASVSFSTSVPTGYSQGDLWYNTASNQLYSFDASGNTVLIGPQQTLNAGTTQMLSASVVDSSNNSHAIIKGVANGTVVFTISNDAFLLGSANPIAGFDYISPGITLVDTLQSQNGVTTGGYQFTGTATNSLRLAGHTVSDFILGTNARFSSIAQFSDSGFTVGTNNALLTVSTLTSTPTITSGATTLTFNTTLISGSTKTPLVLSGGDVLPGQSGVSNLGNSSYQWASVYAGHVYSTCDNANFLQLGSGQYLAASTSSSPNTIAARDSSGNLTANFFNGTATSAQYADLAEKYLPDSEYEPGTVVKVGGDAEITMAGFGDNAIGVISTNPAYMMNKDLEGGVYVALKGRVPVRVLGAVSKGDSLMAAGNGCAQTDDGSAGTRLFAIALEDNDSPDVKLVECVVL